MHRRKKHLKGYKRLKQESTFIEFSYWEIIIKIIIFILIFVIKNYIWNKYNKDIASLELYNEIQNKFNEKKYEKALNIISKNETNLTSNCKILLLRAKIFYNRLEYYKSLKDCEKCINLLEHKNKKNFIEIYQLSVLNYIKMFDLENAKEKFKLCQIIDKNNIKNKELFLLIKEEGKKKEENIKKYKQYPLYLNFMQSLYKKGLYLNKLEISFISESYRFCRATENIYKNDLLFQIPLEGIITLDVAKQSEIGKYFTDQLEKKLDSPRHSLLTAFILNEIDKGNQSEWKYYIDFFPADYSSFPVFYGEKEYNYLKGTQFLESIEDEIRSLKHDYKILVNEISGFSKYDFNFYKKIREVVTSRVFGVKIGGKSNTILVPYADLLNHQRPVQTYWDFNDTSNAFYIKSESNIMKGNEVFDSYGIKSNKNFLLYYGFTVENNTHNTFKIDIVVNNSCPYYKEKIEHLGTKNLKKRFLLNLKLYDVKIIEFFSYLRFILYNKPDFRNITSKKPISVENEIDVFNKIRELMTFYLNKYPTTMEYDIDYLKNNKHSMDFNEYNCYVIRIGEKEILHYYLNMANDILELVTKNDIKELNDYIRLFYNNNRYSSSLYKKYTNYLFFLNNQS